MRKPIALMLVAVALAGLTGCGQSNPARPAKPLKSRTALQGMAPLGQQPGQAQPGMGAATDPKLAQLLQAVNQVRQTSSGADITVKMTYHKDDGSTKHVRSRYKYQKSPQRNYLEVLASSEEKVVGTKVSWGTNGKADVRTKFIGFWVTANLDLHDERLKDQRGNFLDETSIDRSFETLLDPRSRVTFKAEGNLNGRPMVVVDVVSPLSLKNVTREVYGIELATHTPILREMYKGDKLIWKMQVESAKANPTLSAKDFAVE